LFFIFVNSNPLPKKKEFSKKKIISILNYVHWTFCHFFRPKKKIK